MEESKVLVGTYCNAIILDQNDFSVLDTLYEGRCTKVFYHRGKSYIGTLNGLYVIDRKKERKFLWHRGTKEQR